MAPAEGRLLSDAIFRYALQKDPGALDHAINVQGGLLQFLAFAYDGLVASTEGNEIVSNLATKWEQAPRKVTFTIREGVTCSDGSAVTPGVIAKSFQYYQRPDVQYPLFGAAAGWKVRGDDERGTVTFTFTQPVGFPVESLADIPVVCGKGVADRRVLRDATSGSGPYVLKEAVRNQRYVLERRDGYDWGPDGVSTSEPGMPRTVELRVVEDPSTAANLLLTGELDGVLASSGTLQRLGDDARVLKTPSFVLQNLFNHAEGHPTAEADVRRALTMALDPKALAEVAQGRVASSLVAPLTNPCPDPANAEAIPKHDPAAAAKLLDDAGWRAGADGVRVKDGTPLRLEVPTQRSGEVTPEQEAAFELAVRTWRDLGIDVKTQRLGPDASLQVFASGDWDVQAMGPIFGVPDPSLLTGLLSGPPPPKGQNFAHIDNPAYDEAVQRALTARSREVACEGWNAAERALFERADFVPVVTVDVLYAMGDNVDFKVGRYGVMPTSVRMHEG